MIYDDYTNLNIFKPSQNLVEKMFSVTLYTRICIYKHLYTFNALYVCMYVQCTYTTYSQINVMKYLVYFCTIRMCVYSANVSYMGLGTIWKRWARVLINAYE